MLSQNIFIEGMQLLIKQQRYSGMAFDILDPEYDSELRKSSRLGFGMCSRFSVVDHRDRCESEIFLTL